jgi:hypothetical protein
MQAEHELPRAQDHDVIKGNQEHILSELKELRREIAALRQVSDRAEVL